MEKDGIYIKSTANVIIEGGTIAGNTGIQLDGAGTLAVNAGTITGKNTGIQLNGAGTLTIGQKDGNINSEKPSIIGTSYGIYNKSTGTINFYDGIIKGAVKQSIYGNVTEVEEGYDIIKTVEENIETAMLGNEPLVINTVTNTKYNNIAQAVEKANERDTLQVLRDITTIGTQITTIETNKNIVLDLNGKNISFGQANAITNKGTLEIKDSSKPSIGSITSTKGNIIINEEGAKLVVTSGTISNTGENINAITNEGTMQIDGGTLTVTGNSSKVINNENEGTVTINNGEIITTYNIAARAVVNNGGGNIIVNGGTITSVVGIDNLGTGAITVEGGSITGSNYGIRNSSEGTVTVERGSIKGEHGICNEGAGTITINNGEITGTRWNGAGISNRATGTVIVEGGTITSGNGIWNEGAGTITVNNGEIKGTSGDGAGINNRATGTVTVEGGTITGANGIWNEKAGTITVNNGEITVTVRSGTGINNRATGIITIGQKGGNVNSEKPSITGTAYGVYNANAGTINFYDGIIKGATNQSIYGTVAEIEEGYDIVKTTEGNIETAILAREPLIINTETNTEYYNMEQAIEEANEGDTLQVLREIVILLTQGTIVIEANKNIVLDLNGKNIRFGNENAISNKGTLEIKDSSNSKTGGITNTVGKVITNEEGATLVITSGAISNAGANTNLITNKGIMQVDGGTLTATGNASKVINNEKEGTVTINNGEIITTSGWASRAIVNSGEGEIIINNGEIINRESNSAGIDNLGTGTIRVIGGTITGRDHGVYNANVGNIIVTGGSISGNNGIRNSSEGTVIVEEGTITGSNGIWNEGAGTITINNGEIRGTKTAGINNRATGTVTVEGGTITGDNGDGINNRATGIVTVEGGTITGDNGIWNEKAGTITINNGEIRGTKTAGINNRATGIITIGQKDGNVNSEKPSITGTTYGIYNEGAGTINFYDGVIKGTTHQSIYGNVTEIEEGYDIIKTVEENIETAILGNEPLVVNTVTNTKYNNIAQAVEKANEGDTLQVLRDITTVSSQGTIVIETDKNIVLDLNGKNISFGQANAITNKGTLEIKDSSKPSIGSITSTKGNIIINEEGAKLVITSGAISNVEENTNLITNKGTMQVDGGILTTTANASKVINNENEGTVTINNGEIISAGGNSIAIINNGEGNIIVNGGKITATMYNSGGIDNLGTGTITVAEGTITTSGYGVRNSSEGIVRVEGGSILGDHGIYNRENGTIIINEGEVTGRDRSGGSIGAGVYNNNGIITVEGGTITGGCGIYNNGTGTITINNGEITGTYNAFDSAGIYNRTGTVTITGGIITSANHGVNNVNAGTITIGQKDGNVSTEIPSITGTTYGAYNAGTGTINFYDGIIKGTTQAIVGNVADIEPNYEIKYSENTTVAILDLIATTNKKVSIGNTYYDTLRIAINNAKDEDVIELWVDIILDSAVQIPEGKNITINLNGHTLDGRELINGNVTIVDGTI